METRAAAWLDNLVQKAERRADAGLRRELSPRGPVAAGSVVDDGELIDLAGNDYLGLSRHPEVVAGARAALAGYGLGATGSRLVRGSTRLHAALEDALAGWLGTGSALVFSSGYLANIAAVRAVAGPGTVLLSDRHAHASLIDGCRLSGAEVAVVPHADPEAAAGVLAATADRPGVMVTESVFSVDGDLAPLVELHRVCRRYGAVLLVDDAHGCGLLGPAGAGGVAAAGLAGQPDVVITTTLSKAFGASGGVVAGPAALIADLVDTGRTFIFDTALPPALAGGALAALELIRAGDPLRAELADRAALVVRRLSGAGLAVSAPAAGVVSVAAAGPRQAVEWARACRARGVAVGCFRPPSTPDGRSRLRLTINVGVPRERFEDALSVIEECAP